MKKIPLVDLKAQYKLIQNEVNSAISQVVTSTQFVLGPQVAKFEEEFAKFIGTKYAVGTSSGLSALELGMRACNIGPGDEVITPANSFIASSSCISFTGAKPVLVDCDPTTFNIDYKKIEEKITNKTKAIMPVHLFGRPAPMSEITKTAKKHHLIVIEDACQAHGAWYKSKKAGSIGKFAAFSFYPGKNLGAFGDAGLLTTNDRRLAETVRHMTNYGQSRKYHHRYLAWNSRLDTLQAAILLTKLKYLTQWNQSRREIANMYTSLLSGLPVITPDLPPDNISHVFHQYVIRTKQRNQLAKFLAKKGISTGIHYPIPIHLQKAYKSLGYHKGDFPVTEKLASEILSLPIYPELQNNQIKYIAQSIREFFNL